MDSSFRLHVKTNFICAVIGVFAGSLVTERCILWEEIITLQVAFEVPLFIVGDFNETLNLSDKSSKCLNVVGSREFGSFISNCNLLEHPLNGC
jgi:hypothetical protein